MTPEHSNEPALMHDRPATAWDAAAALGIDMSLIELSLRRTPAERFSEHARMLRFAWELREAMRRNNEAA